MQTVLLISEAEWSALCATVTELTHQVHQLLHPTPEKPDPVLTTAQAAEYIGLSTDALRRARRGGRIQGVRLNEKDWGFRCSALDAYPRRYHRATFQPGPLPGSSLAAAPE
ncbi:helix-turn-helix domain-containing protein [Hymenobacter defluvii]|uniref:Helix-turn-helix domain-containing protein n=1 Tax=Hymenobacter defluvii TaxID=2054411 RepID=A0ABS3TIE4_9BACT|nr:helix-turn-helix domain-containing protein [Hymenobacter defluvii]MBO3272354.1 helix-turn-helix domain-containing protein [Hymenobacter defluvii]